MIDAAPISKEDFKWFIKTLDKNFAGRFVLINKDLYSHLSVFIDNYKAVANANGFEGRVFHPTEEIKGVIVFSRCIPFSHQDVSFKTIVDYGHYCDNIVSDITAYFDVNTESTLLLKGKDTHVNITIEGAKSCDISP
jgi:hypothetical protein